jgi:hypothetical protein
MENPVAVARFQLQVVRAFKSGLAKAREKVHFYERMLKSDGMDESQIESLKLSISMHKHEVSVYKKLLASARKKLEK